LTISKEAPRGAAEGATRSPEEVYEQICRELELIRLRLGLVAESDHREGSAAASLLPAPHAHSRERLLSHIAADIYALRRRRNRHLPAHLVAEPAWDLLLSFMMEPSKSQTVGNACIAADVPPTTALRWIALLEQEGLLTRSRASGDGRMIVLSLTDKGGQMMEVCLRSMLSP
jgi:DNA-binding MarR family transcriptional regulator